MQHVHILCVGFQWPMSRPSARRILSIHPCTVWPACVIPTITKPIKADTLCIWQSFGLWSSWDQPWEVTVDPGSHLLPEHPRVSTVLAISVIFVAPSQISWSRFPKLTICIPSTRSASVKLSKLRQEPPSGDLWEKCLPSKESCVRIFVTTSSSLVPLHTIHTYQSRVMRRKAIYTCGPDSESNAFNFLSW